MSRTAQKAAAIVCIARFKKDLSIKYCGYDDHFPDGIVTGRSLYIDC